MTPNTMITEQYRRNTTDLFKHLLDWVEEIKEKHDNSFDKLEANCPEESLPTIKQARFLDKRDTDRIRKKILDFANDNMRNMESDLNRTTVVFNFTKR